MTLEDTFEVGDDYLEDKLDEGIEDEDEETEEDDKIFGFIPNPLTPVFKLQKDIQSNVDSLLSKIPIISWNTNVYIYLYLSKTKLKFLSRICFFSMLQALYPLLTFTEPIPIRHKKS